MAKAKKKRGILARLGRLLVFGASAFILGSALMVLLLRFMHPPASALMVERRVASWFPSEDRKGPYRSRHTWVPLEEMAPSVGLAVIAGEDQLFPEHSGFDWKAIEKAYAHNEHSRKVRGASTVSQQTAKNLFLWESRSWLRKGLEAWFTLLLEAEWPKRRILETYLNIVEFGDGIYGVEAAARTYFGKPARRLTASEAALLAAVLPNPHKYRVDAPSAYVRGRQEWILRQMRNLGGDEVVKAL